MQGAETVYEFGSSLDEDDDDTGQTNESSPSSSHKKKNTKNPSKSFNHQASQQPTSIAGSNLRHNKTSSTSINQILNTSFSSNSDKRPASQSPNLKRYHPSTSSGLVGTGNNSGKDLSASHDQLLLKDGQQSGVAAGGSAGGGSPNIAGGSISNTSNTSISSTTNSSRGNVSQSDNQSIGVSSQKSTGAHQASSSSSQQQNPNFDSNVISERVKNLATQIYQELKRIISRCNYDEDILSGLMPLIVRVLESLDLALIENQQLQVELELCKDDNEQLVIIFEKEKAAKRAIDKKLIESEYAYEEERQQYQQRIESLDSVVKMFELKAKNASDQAARFEEKETERKKEYNKLHDRYTELLKSHCDVVERVRHLAGNTEIAHLSNINVPQHMVASSSELNINDSVQTLASKAKQLNRQDENNEHSRATGLIRNRESSALKSWNAETELTLEDASLVVIEDMLDINQKASDGSSHNESDRTISEPEGEHEKEGENDSIAYTSMEKEFRKLIQENKDLLNTKNALNVVKDDLIAEVDRLTNEVSMYEQAVEQLNLTKDQMKQKVFTLDAELRKTKEELEKAKQKIRENNEEGIPYSQRKRFGRAEMAKVLMERNNYKEKLMELQDAMRYSELVRANKVETEKRSGLWKFFSNLFGTPLREPLAIGGPGGGQTLLQASRNSSPVVSYHGGSATSSAALMSSSPTDQQAYANTTSSDTLQGSGLNRSGAAGGSIRSINQSRFSYSSNLVVLMDSDLNVDRSRSSLKSAGARLAGVGGSDISGYIHAYGWSLPATSVKSLSHQSASSPEAGGPLIQPGSDLSHMPDGGVSFNKLSGLQVPIPQCCRPLTGDSLGMKIWCATAIDLSGGDLSKTEVTSSGSMATDVARTTAMSTTSSPGVTELTATNQITLKSDDDFQGNVDSSGSIVNISTSTPIKSPNRQALRMLEMEVNKALQEPKTSSDPFGSTSVVDPQAQRPILKTTSEMLSSLPMTDDQEELSTCVWICSTKHSRSKITIIDIKTKPNELLDSFYVPTFLYCIKSVPGCKPSDLLGITPADLSTSTIQSKTSAILEMISELIQHQKKEFYKLVRVDPNSEVRLRHIQQSQGSNVDEEEDCGDKSEPGKGTNDDDEEISRILDNNVSAGIVTLQKLNDFVAHSQPHSSTSVPGTGTTDNIEPAQDPSYYQPISTHLSTVWTGGRNSTLYIHSAIGQWKDCVACVKLQDSILQICHYRGRVFVALADGTLCVFFRNVQTKQWEISQYLLMDINLMSEVAGGNMSDYMNETDQGDRFCSPSRGHTTTFNEAHVDDQSEDTGVKQLDETQVSKSASASYTPSATFKSSRSKTAGIRCLEIANKNLWIGYRNRILIIDPVSLKLKHSFSVVPQVDNQIRQLIAMKDGIFCCLRSDLILRLYSSLRPYQHIHNIDIEPIVSRVISPKTFVISHITAMKVAGNTLWIGNAHGIILTIPCQLLPQISETSSGAGNLDESAASLSIARSVPKCDITNAQISFHGHKDAVKFFLLAHELMLSGGQGYLDFRLDMDDQSKSISDKSHLILWQLPQH